MQRIIFQFNIKQKQVRNIPTARATAEIWEMMLETSCLLAQLLDDMEEAKDEAGDRLFEAADLDKARTRAKASGPVKGL